MSDATEPRRPIAEHHVDLPVDLRGARAGLEGVTETWGGRLQDEELVLPVVAGLRRGVVRGRVGLEKISGGSRLSLLVDHRTDRLQIASVVLLSLGLLGALAATLWPFSDLARAVAPTGMLLAIGCWFLVISRLQNSGPEEFLDAVKTWVERSSSPTSP